MAAHLRVEVMSVLLPTDLSEVFRHVESTYPAEGCGVILKSKAGAFRVRPMANVYDKYHRVDPERFPRTSLTAYLFDPKEWLAVSTEADEKGDEVVCIFHSHADVGAYFSQEDQVSAAPDGEPLFPGVNYLVVAVDKGKATGSKVFQWGNGKYEEAR
jgi:[CysO sulfur-carrier protein]-S-L-cysteine hydrolase